MILENIDWALILIYATFTIFIGLKYRSTANKNLTGYFLGGRNLPWYIAGISMVATTFAADTPLAVTELVAKNGISGNWLWWNMLIGGMLTTFFFARLWRRSGVLTELEFIELRYGGKAAAFLRGFKSVYLGLFMNMLIMGWVNLAMATILKVFFNIPEDQLIWWVGLAMLAAAVYSVLSGLKGVAVTDAVQFIIAVTGSVVLAVVILSSEKIGGIAGLKNKLPAWAFNFFPRIGSPDKGNIASALTISAGAFLAYIGVQWWASWYPGAEPGGGGYVAQRMMSTKNEKHSIWATLFFQIAHYTLRPWPWILVGLASLVLYPDLAADEKKMGYVMAIRDFLPAGLKGLLLTALIAAYMSTISTQLNWGASFLVNDLYKRFIKPESSFKDRGKTDRHYVLSSRLVTVFLMVVSLLITSQMSTITGVWLFLLECGAGLGLVLILRWYWWRINAFSEITATITPFLVYGITRFFFDLQFPESFFLTVSITTISWLLVTFLSKPEKDKVLDHFYQKVKPSGNWGKFEKLHIQEKEKASLLTLFICWISSIVMTYAVLFLSGKVIFGEWKEAVIWAIVAVAGLIVMIRAMKKF